MSNVVSHYDWKRYVVTYLDGDARVNFAEAVTFSKKDEFIKDRLGEGTTILAVNEIQSQKSLGKCPKCRKPFVLGDVVYNMSFAKHTVVFLDRNLAYFGEKCDGEDSFDNREQLRYIVHANDVSEQQVEAYREGRRLWDEGMKICSGVKANFWKL